MTHKIAQNHSEPSYILHLSHTDVTKDARICRQLSSLAKNITCQPTNLLAVGVRSDYGGLEPSNIDGVKIEVFELWSNSLKDVFRPLWGLCFFFELNARVINRVFGEKMTVIHCHDWVMLPIAVVLKIKNKCNLIYDAHELESQKNGQGRVEGYLVRVIEKLVWGKVDFVISVSNSIVDWYNKNYGLKASEIIFNAPMIKDQPPSEAPSKVKIRKNFGISPDIPLFVYAGLIDHGRGIEKTTKIFEDYPHIGNIVFIGWGPLTDFIIAKGHSTENIHFHSPVHHYELVSFISDADYGVCLLEPCSKSDSYALPNKIFEYLSAGLIVLASDLPELKTFFSDSSFGVTTPIGERDILHAIEKIRTMKKLKRVEIEKFSWPFQEKKLLNIYRKMVGPFEVSHE